MFYIEEALSEAKYVIKRIAYGFQRMFRGYDDIALWSLDDAICKLSYDIIKSYRHSRNGSPVIDGATEENCHEQWDGVLDSMIQQLEIVIKDDYNSDEQLDAKNKFFELLSKYHYGLWD